MSSIRFPKSKIKCVCKYVTYSEEQLRGIFKRHDLNHDGYLDVEELRMAFWELGARLPTLRAALALHHADRNGDGRISEGELEQLLKYALKRCYTSPCSHV